MIFRNTLNPRAARAAKNHKAQIYIDSDVTNDDDDDNDGDTDDIKHGDDVVKSSD